MAIELFEQQKKVEIQHLEEQIKWTKIRIPYLISVKAEKEARKELEAIKRQRGEGEEEKP